MPVIPPGFADVSIPIQHDLVQRTAYTTWGVEVEVGGGDPDSVANDLQTIWNDTIRTLLDSQCRTGPLRVTIGQDGSDPTVGFGPRSDPGGRATSGPSPAIALLVRKRTGLGGRRNRGFMYLPWATGESQIDEGGNIGGGEITTWNAVLDSFHGSLAAGGFPMVILHDTGVSATPDPTPVTGLDLKSRVSNQVRRQRS